MSDVVEAGFVRVRLVATTISGGPEMTEENVKIAVHALRRVSEARARAQRAQAGKPPKSRKINRAK